MRIAATVIAAALAVAPVTAIAQVTPTTPLVRSASEAAIKKRADALIGVLNGTGAAKGSFSAGFLAAVPEAQLAAISAQLRDQVGTVRGVTAIRPEGNYAATIDYAYARGTVTMRLAVDPEPPHLTTGLLVTKVSLAEDSFDKINADVSALPGSAGFTIARLDASPTTIAQVNGDRAYAIGSAFKLYVLAEAIRAVGAGERRWDGIVPLARKSLPSGFLHNWPAGAPMTLHSLASLMISQSDNSATDTLIAALGRDRIEAMVGATGHAAPARNQPFLQTSEMFRLKSSGGAALLARWSAADAAGRRRILTEIEALNRARTAYGSFSASPVAIDTVEWFATPHDIVRALDWIRRNDSDGTGKAILAINPGIGAAAAEHGYLGFKGGSEPGVVNLSFLVRSKAGVWHAISGSWNDPKAPVQEAKFVALMSRAVALTAR